MKVTTTGDEPLKFWHALLILVLLLPIGLWFGKKGLVCFEGTGPWWRGRVMDSFVETQGTVTRADSQRQYVRSSTMAIEISLSGTFQVDGVEHHFSEGIERRTSDATHGGRYDDQGAAARAREIFRNRPTTRVYYDPANPSFAVISKENIPGFSQIAVLAFFGCIIGLIGLMLTATALSAIPFYVQQQLQRKPSP